jgi:hypothetical protein
MYVLPPPVFQRVVLEFELRALCFVNICFATSGTRHEVDTSFQHCTSQKDAKLRKWDKKRKKTKTFGFKKW